MPERYCGLLGERIGVQWPRETWLSDVDSGFYVACYLRAWALEVDWRAELGEQIRGDWFENAEAGAWLRDSGGGARARGERLLAEAAGRGAGFRAPCHGAVGDRLARNPPMTGRA